MFTKLATILKKILSLTHELYLDTKYNFGHFSLNTAKMAIVDENNETVDQM